MNEDQARRVRLTLSLRQMMKLVVFAAAASACVAPFVQLMDMGLASWSVVLVWGAVAVPLVLALTAFPMVRRGPLKDWLIRVFLLISVGDALGFAISVLVWFVSESVRRRVPLVYSFLGQIAGIIIILGLALVVLLRKVVPRRCPDCRWRTLIPDATSSSGPGDNRTRCYQCLRCQGRFEKHVGSREAVPAELLPASLRSEPVESPRGSYP